MDNKPLRSFLEIPYNELEEMNLQAKKRRKEGRNPKRIHKRNSSKTTDYRGRS